MKRKLCRHIVAGIFILNMMLNVGIQALAAEEPQELQGSQDSQESQESVNRKGKIEANIYLLYSNRLPEDVNQPFGAVEFGPSGNNTAYITVTVDLNRVQEKARVWVNKWGYQYYSIDSNQRVDGDAQRMAAMKSYWETVIYPAIDQEDSQALDQVFGGTGNFYGYVLKKENYDVWHIDGILAKDPPVYVVELYDYTSGSTVPLFGISSNGAAGGGVGYQNFRSEAERVLGGSEYRYSVETGDRIELNYFKDGKSYQAVITPKDDEGAASQNYHVYPEENKFGYRQVSAGVYYLSRMKIVTKENGCSLSLKKNVTGGMANPDEHFRFRMVLKDKYGMVLNGTYKASYTGTENCGQSHAEQLTFSNSGTELFLKNGESVVVSGLPGGSAMMITETAGNYRVTTKIDGVEKDYGENGLRVSPGDKMKSVEFTNHKAAVPLTGRTVEVIPYLMVTGIAVIGGTGFRLCCRHRRRWEK